MATREQRRHAERLEARAKRSGRWGEWRKTEMPFGFGSGGWTMDVRAAYANDLYAVLVRPIACDLGLVHHCAIRTASNFEPPWRDKQRIKDELFGHDLVAVEVMPRLAEVVDQADMYHMFILPGGFSFPFGI